MNIVHVITRLIVGGAQENTLISCLGQHRHGHQVTLITGPPLGPEGSLMARASEGGYAIETIDAMRRAILPVADYKTYRALVKRFQELRPDVVHTHSSKAGIIGRFAAHAAGVPVVVHTIHGLAFTASKRAWVNEAYKFAERRTAPITTKIVCVADAMRDQSLAAGIGKREQYVTIYSGMDIEPFIHPPIPPADLRQRLSIADDEIIVGTIARLFELKGHDDLLNSAPDLCQRFPNLRFLWVGDGLLRKQFEQRIASMGLTDRFILTGLVPPAQVPELTGAMDILAHPSRREGLARALPQGALAAKPCVTYDIDGAKEAVGDGVSGFVVPPFDVKRFADAIATLAPDMELRQRMGAAGRAMASRRFASQTMVDALEDLYAQCLKQSGAAVVSHG
jgi:glycosyltransferase involved in cell wall biosynthesis